MTAVLSDFSPAISLARRSKLDWIAEGKTPHGDMPPAVLVERSGETLAVVVAPQVDKYMALNAARVCRVAFDADALTAVLDSHIALTPLPPPKTIEEAARREVGECELDEKEAERLVTEKWPAGSMQKAREEGACDRGEITQVLVVSRVERGGRIATRILPYEYDGKDPATFKWLDASDRPDMPMLSVNGVEEDDSKDGVKFRGFIPDSLREIIAEAALVDREPILQAVAAREGFDRKRQLYHSGRAAVTFLETQGYKTQFFGEKPEEAGDEPVQ
jgi:hypothetical protein